MAYSEHMSFKTFVSVMQGSGVRVYFKFKCSIAPNSP